MGVENASATRHAVVVNGVTYSVRGTINRVAFTATLLSCGEQDAAIIFDLWSRHKQTTNVTVASGLIAPWLWVGSGFFAVLSAGDKALLIEALTHDEPVEARRERLARPIAVDGQSRG